MARSSRIWKEEAGILLLISPHPIYFSLTGSLTNDLALGTRLK